MRFRYLNQLWIRRCEIIWDLLKSGRFKTLFLKSLDFLHRLVKPAVEINYKDWRERGVELPAKKRAAIVSSIPEMPIKPVFTLLLNAENIEMPILESTIFSTTRQLYPYWNLELFGNVSAFLEISKVGVVFCISQRIDLCLVGATSCIFRPKCYFQTDPGAWDD